MKSQKIMLVTTSFPKNRYSHSGIFVKRLADALDSVRSENIEVIVPKGPESEALSTPYRVVQFRYLPKILQDKIHGEGGIPAALENNRSLSLLIPFLALGLFFSVYRRTHRSTIIIANWTLAGLVCGLVGIFKRCPVVTVLRGSDVNRAKNSKISRIFLWFSLKWSQRVVCVSDELRTDVLGIFPSDSPKVRVIQNGIEAPVPSQKNFSKNRILSLVFVGSATRNKNLSSVLRALGELAKKKVRFELNVVGDGPESENLKAQAAKLMLPSVKFHGAVPPERVFEFLNGSLVFINASFSEGRSNALVEAISSGCVAVVSDIPGNRALISHGESGLLFDPSDSSSLASQLLWIEHNRAEAERLASEGTKALTRRSALWRECAEEYSKLLTEL